ncbi:MAG: xanthine dehydrogenase accessory protein XdhC [Flavobacteriaceae bacterium]|nr:MAG: xanthine dehydrogenase accessory protein XdhC [Flavobacteriaceae bacterium]
MNNWIELLHHYKKIGQAVALVTVSKVMGSAPCIIGSKMIVCSDKKTHGTIGGGKMEFEVTATALDAIKQNKFTEITHTLGPKFEQCCGGVVTLIIEPMIEQSDLYIFGAGHIGLALANILKESPFKLHLLDTRKDWSEQLTLHDQVHYNAMDFDLYKQKVRWGAQCYTVIVTHDHVLDFEITALAISQKTKYIGLIGSKTKRQKFHLKLQNELQIRSGLDAVHCPMGLDIGGHRPNEIAISIAAELLKTYYAQ